MVPVIRIGSIFALLFAIGGASVIAEELRKAELLLCSDKAKECNPVAVFQTEVGCKSIISTMDAWKTWEKLYKICQSKLDLCSSTPAPTSAAPSEADKTLERLKDFEKSIGRFSYMCRPM